MKGTMNDVFYRNRSPPRAGEPHADDPRLFAQRLWEHGYAGSDLYLSAGTAPAHLSGDDRGYLHAVRYRPFLQRVEELLIESEMRPMNYLSSHHQNLFQIAIQKKDRKNYALLSALYLFTADQRLWRIMRHQVDGNLIRFDRRKLCGLNEYTYLLYCAAKDLYMGTRHLTIWDLADRELLSPKQFAAICNAMAIRRFGLKAVEPAEKKEEREP